MQADVDRDISELDEIRQHFGSKVDLCTFKELVELETKLDPSLGYLQHHLKRIIITRMKQELEIGLRLLEQMMNK